MSGSFFKTIMIPLPVSSTQIVYITKMLSALGVPYVYGAKDCPIGHSLLTELKQHGLDCSGFSKTVIWRSPKPNAVRVVLPDGSVEQHEWVKTHAFTRCEVADGHLLDGALRIAFLAPVDNKPGHVMLIHDGQTCECYGHHGVGRRDWGSEPFMHECEVYLLTLPDEITW